MDKLFDMLKNSFDGLTRENIIGIQERCFTIAKTLSENYCIICGDKTFRFAEVEFYYYKSDKSNKNNFVDTWNRETYPRNKNAGEFFFHYSGVDICFQCYYDDKEKDNEYGEFGGILIRSLLDGKKILAGPLFCANVILNASKDCMPTLDRTDYQQYKLKSTTRCGITSDLHQEKGKELYLCYYATKVNGNELYWENASERVSWDKKKRVFRKITRNYKKERNFK